MRRELERIEIPGEHDARDRSLRLAKTAFVERQPAPRAHRRKLIPAIAIVATGAIAAAAISSPGNALLNSIRQSVGVRNAQPALFGVATPGTLLVHSDSGAWVVQSDGAKRRLGAYTSASWSPHGLYIAATHRNELLALTPKGEARWSLARPAVRFPRWAGTAADTRIAYLTRSRLHVVRGDGTKDLDECGEPAAARIAPAWRPGSGFVLAFATTRGRVKVLNADACSLRWASPPGPVPTRLMWSSDGTRLLALEPHSVRVFDAHGKAIERDDTSDGTRDTDATFLPGTTNLAVVQARGAQSDVLLLGSGRSLFHVAGQLGQIVASPDGRWLLVAWPDADQWIFVPVSASGHGGRVRAIANVSAQFRSQTFPRIEGWCCAR